MIVSVSQPAFLRSCDGCSEGGEEDDIVGILLEDVLDALLYEAGHYDATRCAEEAMVGYNAGRNVKKAEKRNDGSEERS